MSEIQATGAEQPNPENQSQFLERLNSLPVVNSAVELATQTYDRVKQSSSIAEYTLTAAEKSVNYANDKVQPLVQKFRKQIDMADDLACQGLGKLEETVPVITKPTEMIVQDTKDLLDNTIKRGKESYEGVKSYGVDKVNAVKQYGYDTASGIIGSPYGKLVTNSVDGCLIATESTIDNYLPAVDDEDELVVREPQSQQVLIRVTRITNKIKHRALHHAMSKVNQMKQTTEESLIQTADAIKKPVTKTCSDIRSNAAKAWEQLNVDPEPLPENATLNDQVLSIARHTTKQLVSAFVTAKATVQEINSKVSSGINSVFDLSSNVFEHLKKLNPQELDSLMSQLKSIKLDENVNYVITVLGQTTVMQWLVQNKQLQPVEGEQETAPVEAQTE